MPVAAAYSAPQDLSALHAPEIQVDLSAAAPAASSAAPAAAAPTAKAGAVEAGPSKSQPAKRGAVIGAAPKLNPEGILAAAREEKAKKEAAARKQQQVGACEI